MPEQICIIDGAIESPVCDALFEEEEDSRLAAERQDALLVLAITKKSLGVVAAANKTALFMVLFVLVLCMPMWLEIAVFIADAPDKLAAVPAVFVGVVFLACFGLVGGVIYGVPEKWRQAKRMPKVAMCTAKHVILVEGNEQHCLLLEECRYAITLGWSSRFSLLCSELYGVEFKSDDKTIWLPLSRPHRHRVEQVLQALPIRSATRLLRMRSLVSLVIALLLPPAVLVLAVLIPLLGPPHWHPGFWPALSLIDSTLVLLMSVVTRETSLKSGMSRSKTIANYMKFFAATAAFCSIQGSLTLTGAVIGVVVNAAIGFAIALATTIQRGKRV
ncbi:hypothetical protein [Aeoliella mucimassa]|nr:hypothetical protein [Aeoliella mucimassa]